MKHTTGVEITFKLFATLGDYLPPELDGKISVDNQLSVALPEGATVQDVTERFKLPPRMIHLVLVNGVYVPPGERLTRQLRNGDALAIWPPIAGG